MLLAVSCLLGHLVSGNVKKSNYKKYESRFKFKMLLQVDCMKSLFFNLLLMCFQFITLFLIYLSLHIIGFRFWYFNFRPLCVAHFWCILEHLVCDDELRCLLSYQAAACAFFHCLPWLPCCHKGECEYELQSALIACQLLLLPLSTSALLSLKVNDGVTVCCLIQHACYTMLLC